MLSTAPGTSDIIPSQVDLDDGLFIDKIVYKVIASQDQRVLALQAGEIEMDASFFYPVNYPALSGDPDIDIAETLRNGYGHISFNCGRYPMNISAFRRAFAFAFDKNKVTDEVMNGYSKTHDSIVPYSNPMCIEDELEWHYYDARPDIGNAILDDIGFPISNTTGVRQYPDGSPIRLVILSSGIGNDVADIAIEAFQELHINATRTGPMCCETYYDMYFSVENYPSNDLSWLATEYWSENADEYVNDWPINPTQFRNSTFDSWRDQLLHGTSFDEVSEAAAEMQKILHYNVPRLVVYQDIYLQAYRNDVFTGHIDDELPITNPWTMLKIHKLDGSSGGTVPIAIPAVPEDLNFFHTIGGPKWELLENLHLSLYTPGPDLEPYPRLASSVIIETHSDNQAVAAGHTRFTFDIVNYRKWATDQPVTAEDVAFTFNYLIESRLFGNPLSEDLDSLVAAYAPTPDKAVIEFNSESYWHFFRIAYLYILPKQAFTLEPAAWESWNPGFNSSQPVLNCGPFEFTDYEEGEFYELSTNPDYGRAGVVDQLEIGIIPAFDIVRPFSFSGFNITWELDWHSGHAQYTALDYTVFLDGEEYVTGIHVFDYGMGFSLTIEVNSLPPGRYNFTLMLEEVQGGYETDTVMVTIRITEAQIISMASVPIIIILSVLIIRRIWHSHSD